MRKKGWLSIFVIMALLLCSCGNNKSPDNTNASLNNTTNDNLPKKIVEAMEESEEGLYDIQVEETKLSVYLAEGEFMLGGQYEGEEIVFWVGDKDGNVYSYKLWQKKELLLEGLSSAYVGEAVRWWKFDDKYYTVSGKFFNVLKEDGSKAFRVSMGDYDRVSNMCQTENGSVLAVCENDTAYETTLVEINTTTGEVTSILGMARDYAGVSGGAGDGIVIRDSDGVYTYDLKSEEKTWHMKFSESTYEPYMTGNGAWDFRLTEDGDVVLLAKSFAVDEWYEETISKLSFDEINKTILVYRVNFPSAELKEVVTRFNKENENYFVYLDTRENGIDLEDFRRRTNIELSTGNGADLIDYYCVENITSATEKGVFENLEPYMEKSGMKKEDLFSQALRDWDTGRGCYGLGFCMTLNATYMKEEIAKDVLSLKDLLSGLESYEDFAVFSTIYERFPGGVLDYFMSMSTNMYGMLDWENGTCDFSGELWESILENSLRYGHGEENPYSRELTNSVSGGTFQQYLMFDIEARNQEMIPVGYPTEEGMVYRVWVDSICMNAASKNKEGAWEFIEYLLSAESQKTLAKMEFPTVKSVYEEVCSKEIAHPTIIDMVDYNPVYSTEEDVEMVTELLENAKTEPLYTEYVLEIIEEEAESYFSGEKTIEQVSDIIENRIGTYMAENQ